MAVEPIVTLTNGALPDSPQFWLDAAHAAVRRFCGWHVAPVITEELTLDGNGSRSILLPSNRVTAITSVVEDGTPVTDFDWSESGALEKVGGSWSRRKRSLVVTLTHGFDEASDVAGIISGIAARSMAAKDGALSQRAGSMAVTRGASGSGRGSSGGAAVSLPLLATEKEQLAPYLLVWGP